MKLTSRQIELSKPKDKTYTLSDGSGLSLLVYTNGSKSWLFRYTRNRSGVMIEKFDQF